MQLSYHLSVCAFLCIILKRLTLSWANFITHREWGILMRLVSSFISTCCIARYYIVRLKAVYWTLNRLSILFFRIIKKYNLGRKFLKRKSNGKVLSDRWVSIAGVSDIRVKSSQGNAPSKSVESEAESEEDKEESPQPRSPFNDPNLSKRKWYGEFRKLLDKLLVFKKCGNV